MTIAQVLPIYTRTPFVIERGEGVYLFDSEGKRYLDFAAGIAVNALGHCHPHVVAALKKQANTLWHTSNMYRLPGQESLAARLVEYTFADTVFFCNSGTEATEAAIKMVRKYQYEKGHRNKYTILTIDGAFHGRTMAAISASGKEKVMKGFEPALDGFRRIPLNDVEALKAALTPDVGGIMLETIQGEGGVHAADGDYLRLMRQLCDELDVVLVLDEVQCGVGRTGHFFAFEKYGVVPDIVPVAKGIGNGFPLGLTLATERVAQAMNAGSHGTTYGGNPLATAVGNAVLDVVMNEEFLSNVREKGLMLKAKLQVLIDRHPTVLELLRGEGLMLGLVTVVDNLEMVKQLREAGLMTVGGAGNVIRILPPLIIEESHMDEAIALLEKVCQSYE